MYEFTQTIMTIPCVNQDMLILSLAINWKSKRVTNIEPEKSACRAVAPLRIPNSRCLNKSSPVLIRRKRQRKSRLLLLSPSARQVG